LIEVSLRFRGHVGAMLGLCWAYVGNKLLGACGDILVQVLLLLVQNGGLLGALIQEPQGAHGLEVILGPCWAGVGSMLGAD